MNILPSLRENSGDCAFFRDTLPLRHRDPVTDRRIILGRELIRSSFMFGAEGGGVIDLILALISYGIDTRDHLIASVPEISGYGHRYVARILRDYEGVDPKQHYWMRDDTGQYRSIGLVVPKPVSQPRRHRKPADVKSCGSAGGTATLQA